MTLSMAVNKISSTFTLYNYLNERNRKKYLQFLLQKVSNEIYKF